MATVIENRDLIERDPPLISGDDLFFMSQVPFLFLSALLQSSDKWPSAAKNILRFADILRPQKDAPNLDEVARSIGKTREILSNAILVSRVGRIEHLIHSFNLLCRPAWRPTIEIEGKHNLDDALAEENGIVIWVSHFCFSSLFTKMGMSETGYQVVHISRPEHGVSKSKLGTAFLNKIRTVTEDRFLAERIVHHRDHPQATKLRAMNVLENNGIVSITVGAWEGRRVVIAPLLKSTFQVATGAPSLAYASNAKLLPVFTTKTQSGTYRIKIGSPLGEQARGDRDSFLKAASEQLFEQQEPVIIKNSEQWRGWKDWMKLRTIES